MRGGDAGLRRAWGSGEMGGRRDERASSGPDRKKGQHDALNRRDGGKNNKGLDDGDWKCR